MKTRHKLLQLAVLVMVIFILIVGIIITLIVIFRKRRKGKLSLLTPQSMGDKEEEVIVCSSSTPSAPTSTEPVIPDLEKPKRIRIFQYHHNHVKALLLLVAKKWKEIGEAMGLSRDILDEDEYTNNETDEYCMENAIDFWVKYHGPTWEKLAIVLTSVGEEALANYCQALASIDSPSPATS